MTTGLFTHDACFRHVTPPGHPECVERLEAVIGVLNGSSFPGLRHFEAPKADRGALLAAHDKALVDAYAAAGVDRLILWPRPEMDAGALERFAAETGRALGLKG